MLYKKNLSPTLSDELFRNPTSEYRATPFWAWNCKMTNEILTEQIPMMKEMGFGGFHMHSRTGMANEYLSEEFMGLVNACIDKAKDEQMLAWLYDEDRWPSGAAGGYVTKDKKYRMRTLVFTGKVDDRAVAEAKAAIEQDVSLYLAAYDIRLNAKGELESYRRLAPGETGTNVRYAYLKPAVEDPWYNNQTYVDTLNPAAIDRFIQVTHETYKAACAEEFDKTVPAIFTDEPNFGHKYCLKFADSEDDALMPWTFDLEETFRASYGFSILDRLPEIFWDLPDGKPSQARYYYHDHVTQRFTEAFCDKIGSWCEDNGIYLTGHVLAEESLNSQSSCVGETMRTYRGFGIPGIDMLCNRVELTTAKQCQSAVHQFGKEAMLSELYGVTGWEFDFRGHKFQGDWQAALGVTVRVPHLTWVSMEGRAKRDYPACIGYQSPWYKEYKYIEDHFARVNTALTRGKPVVKVGVIHPIESFWLNFGPNQNTHAVRKRLDDQFSSIISYLLFNTVDFDFISESLLPEQCANVGRSLSVGQMEYDTIVVPGCLTLRGTTLEILQKFRQQGGKVIFVGDCPEFVDAQPNEAIQELFNQSCQVPFSESDLVAALEDSRLVSIKNTNGANTATLLYNMRRDTDCTWLFIAHGKPGDEPWLFGRHSVDRCKDLVNAQETIIRVKGVFKPVLYDTLSGTKREISYRIENGWTVIPHTFYLQDSLLLRLEEGEAASLQLPKETAGDLKEKIVLKRAAYRREEPNVYLLDVCQFRLDEGQWEPEEEILRLDNICRARLDIPPRRSRGAQPWVVSQDPPQHSVTMRFTVHSDMEAENALLAIERPFEMEAWFNDQPLDLTAVGYFTDKSIKTVKLPTIRRGDNTLVVKAPLAERKNLEWMYILGDFDVELRGCDKTIIPASKTVGFGSVTTQGMPFYGGNLVYTCEFENQQSGDALIRVNGFRGPAIRAYLDGKDMGLIALSPYTVTAKDLSAGTHTLELKLYGNRCNSFNSLHNCNTDDDWCGENRWYSEGDAWSYEYNLNDFGIVHGPVIEIR